MAGLDQIVEAITPTMEAWGMIPTTDPSFEYLSKVGLPMLMISTGTNGINEGVEVEDLAMLAALIAVRLDSADFDQVVASTTARIREVGAMADEIRTIKKGKDK